MKQVFYKIANHIIEIQSDFSFSLETSYSQPFITQENCADYTYTFNQVDQLPDPSGLTLLSQTFWSHYYSDGQKLYVYFLHENVYHAVTIFGKSAAQFLYLSETLLFEKYEKGCAHETYLDLVSLLYSWNCFVLHSCYIGKADQAILFSAPSGTGKSTQGDLWKKYGNWDVINGDRTAIMRVNEQWKAFGIPPCGTSQISKNKTNLLKAIVVIRQGQENYARRMTAAEAFKAILSEISIHDWDKEYISILLDFVESLVEEVPVIAFSCTQYHPAYVTLREFLLQEGIIVEDSCNEN